MNYLDSFSSFLIKIGLQPQLSLFKDTELLYGYEVNLGCMTFIYKIENNDEIFIPQIKSNNEDSCNCFVKWLKIIKCFEKENFEFRKITGVVIISTSNNSDKLIEVYKKMGAKLTLSNKPEMIVEYQFKH